MGIYYDPRKEAGKRWVVSYEKTDYTADELKTDRPTNLTKTYSEKYNEFVCKVSILGACLWGNNETKTRNVTTSDYTANAINAQLNADGKANQDQLAINKFKNQAYDKTLAIANTTQGGDYTNQRQLIRSFFNIKDSLLPTNLPTGRAVYTPLPTDNYMEVDVPYDSENPPYARSEDGIIWDYDPYTDSSRPRIQPSRMSVPNEDLNNQNAAYNNYYESISQQNAEQNVRNKKINEQKLQANPTLSLQQALEDQFKTFYRTEKLQQWDPALGAKPQYGDFDPAYYKAQNPTVAKKWSDAVADDDIDITERYGENGYYLQHYTTQGKAAGLRGNAPEATTSATGYVEKTPTDADIQAARNLQLGIDTGTQTDRLLAVPYIKNEWDQARGGDPYWTELAKQNYLNVDKKDDFAALFRLSNRPEDKQVAFNYNANAGYGITELEDALNKAVGEKAGVDVKRFGALTQNVLKDTIEEIKKAKQKEQTLSLLQGFGGFSEIMDMNKTLSNSILGDSGVGGILSFTSAGKAEESLLKNLQNVTGIKNNTTYNWQQWFDQTLKQKYSQAQELGYTAGEAKEMVNIDSDFAKTFIEKYLQPRFDESRSMNEFVEYMDIRQEEQNPFTTMDIINAAKLTADTKSKEYLDAVLKTPDRYFDSSFYFNPTGDKARDAAYAEQASTVAEDWEAAKKGDPYWTSQAYRFGIDINNKDQFARMHFQVKGQGQGYDAAEDILNASKVSDEIYGKILPAMQKEIGDNPRVFLDFTTPEEFADQMLVGLDPADKSTWQEVLKRYGLTDFKGTLDELKEYIKGVLQTGSAAEIRSQIKYLNEKRQKPTQEILGLTYIQRPEDYKDTMSKPQTELFQVFQKAGYQGTEDEFYTKFFPDLNRSEQTLLTQAGENKALKTYKLDLSDPFASLGTVESFFNEDDTTPTKNTTTKTTRTSQDSADSYFKLGLDDTEEGYQKSKSGEQILGEFTSMFKGL